MGEAVAKIVLKNGGTAVLIGRREEKTKKAIAELTPYGPVFSETADITNRTERVALVNRLHSQHGDATLLVNAAGVFLPKPFLEHTEADYDRYLEINKAIFFITQCVAKNMVAGKKGGSIVNIGSMWAKQAVQATPSSAYSMAKAGRTSRHGPSRFQRFPPNRPYRTPRRGCRSHCISAVGEIVLGYRRHLGR